jgi:hypothetical protein
MHPLFSKASGITHGVIGAAIGGSSHLQGSALSDTKLLDIPLGLTNKLNVLKLTDGLSRLILPGANLS